MNIRSLDWRTPQVRGYLAMVVASLCFSVMGVGVRLARDGFSLPQLVVVRGTVAICMLLPWALTHRSALGGNARFWLVARALVGTLAVYGNFYALQTIPLGTATVLNQTSPVFAVLLVWGLFGRRPQPVNVVAVVTAITGTILIFKPWAPNIHVWGWLAGLASGFFAAIAFIAIRRMRFSERPEVIVLWFSVISASLSLPFCGSDPWPVSLTVWAYGVLAGLGAYGGQWFMVRSFAYLTATAGSTAGLLGSVFAVGWGILLFGEVMAGWEWLGIVLVIGSGMVPALIVGNRQLAEKPSPFRWQPRN
ncbi:MAG: DMT family transporter [Acidobacteria bacterium]|nr:DMT family transporter [Acidobacteriota bacterium]